MTPEEMRYAASILLAAADGKQIQGEDDGRYTDLAMPRFDFFRETYRIKPEPRECWVNFYKNPAPLAFASKEKAERSGARYGCEPGNTAIHMQEVMDNDT